jgi:ABC-type branched-subunit amino acid transport system substrate-binding protein
MKLGILLPTSQLYPSLMIDFSNGLRMAIAQYQLEHDIELVFESIEQGTDKNLVLKAMNKLVLQDQTDVNILFCNSLMIEEIAPSLNALQRPILIANMGGNIPKLFNLGAFLFTNSFGLWESAHLAAKWGVDKFGKKVAHGSYFYEAGYDLYGSFCLGLKKAGGEVIFNQISEFNPNPNDFQNFMKQMELETPDFLYMLYSDRDAVSFLNKLGQSHENGKYPIVTSGVLLNDEIIERVEYSPAKVFNVSSWDLSDNNAANIKFIEAYNEQIGKDPNYFALLGYECAGTVCAAMTDNGWSKTGKAQAQAIKESLFSGPRGKLNFDNALQATGFEHQVYELNGVKNREKFESIGRLENIEALVEASQSNQNAAGWLQPYLCQ